MLWNIVRIGQLSCKQLQKLPSVGRLQKWYFYQHTALQCPSHRIAVSYSQLQNPKASVHDNIRNPAAVFPTVNDVNSTSNTSKEKSHLIKLETKWARYPKIYMTLSKWYLTLFVAMTADAGYCLAPVMFDQKIFLFATVGTILCSCAANTFNQAYFGTIFDHCRSLLAEAVLETGILEVQYDGMMDRTKNRPLVRNTISPLHATAFGISSGIIGVTCLYFGVNELTAALGLANIILYAGIYTPMKRRHWLNTWAGSIVGAVPPIMGWTAATGTLDPGAFVLAGILYSWQFPHFFALAWRRRGDYARGSYHMLPISHPQATKHVVVAHSVALCGLSLAAPLTGITSWAFVAMSAPFNAWLTTESIRFYRKGNSQSALKLYKCSLYYILVVSLALVVDRKVLAKAKKKWKEELSA